jgi:hypothetical protein
MSAHDRRVAGLKAFLDRHTNEPITPRLLVEDVRSNPSDPLYGEFDWDVDAAAMEHWLDTAKKLLRITITFTSEPTKVVRVPYTVADPSPGRAGRGEYIKITEVISNSDMSRELMVAELRQIRNRTSRAHEIAAATRFAMITARLEEVLTEIDQMVLDVASGGGGYLPEAPRSRSSRRK